MTREELLKLTKIQIAEEYTKLKYEIDDLNKIISDCHKTIKELKRVSCTRECKFRSKI